MFKKHWGSAKQYCAEPEHDPYEHLYRKAEMYSEYMGDTSFKLPQIEEQLADPIDFAETIDSIDLPAHRLTGRVRCQYLNYLENLLTGNYKAWTSTVSSYENVTFTPAEVKRCAASLEMQAVKSCMIVSLYRNCILKMISQIRKETKDSYLHPHLINMKFTPKITIKEACDVEVQTDTDLLFLQTLPKVACDLPLRDVQTMSLDEKIRSFEKSIHLPDTTQPCKKSRKEPSKRDKRATRSKYSRKEQICKRKPELTIPEKGHSNMMPGSTLFNNNNNTTITKSNNANDDDSIMRELEAMFETGDDENIFDSCENQVQIKAIINEIEKFDPSNIVEQSINCKVPIQPEVIPLSPKINFVDHRIDTFSKSEEEDLKKSIWPCEFHMQKLKLREILTNIVDINYQRYERIRSRFLVLFGERDQEEDELGPYSPSIELNDILIASCRQRIAKWVVQGLMKPLNDGLIGNRYLFKKLAKYIADGIIYQNQYPDQQFIKKYIVEYFCTHQAVLSTEDLNH
ncbi:uncharacterized protein LOC131432182 [Malaya genurostris]|uniref:uncharacterized protein LOC131432182 n=1 Tax=Malaya genurostris TaxID=325434 RepID=UPI0026F3E8D1|nr:uncharacterized protein LOC131432182 [Malaya genurostris]